MSCTELIFLRVSSTYRSRISGSCTNKERNKKQHQDAITEAFSRNNAHQGAAGNNRLRKHLHNAENIMRKHCVTTRSNRIIISETDKIPICHQSLLINEGILRSRKISRLWLRDEKQSDTYYYQRTFSERCLLQNGILKVFFIYKFP